TPDEESVSLPGQREPVRADAEILRPGHPEDRMSRGARNAYGRIGGHNSIIALLLAEAKENAARRRVRRRSVPVPLGSPRLLHKPPARVHSSFPPLPDRLALQFACNKPSP